MKLKELMSEEDYLYIGDSLKNIESTITEYEDDELIDYVFGTSLGDLLREIYSNK